MIANLQFRNVRVIQEANLRLQRLSVVVGPNGAGKSTLLIGIRAFAERRLCDPGDIVNHQLLSIRGQTVISPLRATFEVIDDGESTRVEHVYEGSFSNAGQLTTHLSRNGQRIESTSSQSKVSEAERNAIYRDRVWQSLEPCLMLNLNPQSLVQPSITSRSTVLAPDGENLTTMLANLATTESKLLDQIRVALAAVVPAIRTFRLVQLNPGEVGYQVVFEKSDGTQIVAGHASEGTLLVLGYLTALLGAGRPRLLLVENIDRGLHPRALGDLVSQARRILERFPDLQIIATSHSPYLLEHVEPEEVCIGCLTPEGTAILGNLTDHPRFEQWKDEMSPGEFWSAVGESWLHRQESEAHAS